jgi:hypothetical protein
MKIGRGLKRSTLPGDGDGREMVMAGRASMESREDQGSYHTEPSLTRRVRYHRYTHGIGENIQSGKQGKK